ncbi:MAG: tetratricopeptide repeat protein [Acidaminococcus intestini]|uniref:Tetratricopeptide repeat protein n=1 Tax=Acidaminococcus intestini TaxID=187327 RepID=A0A943I1K8_9FIRM|nr:tetratricopeptide repeat protein [Acidaminococcus intestini]
MTMVHEFYEHLDALYEKGDAAGVEAYLTEIANSTYKEGRESDLMLSALNELGSFYRGRSYYEASYAAFMKAKEILDGRGETRGVPYATLLINLAGTKRLAKDYSGAKSLYDEAMEILTEAGEKESYAYLSCLNNLSILYQEMERPKDAAAALEEALERLMKVSDRFEERAITCCNLGILYAGMDQDDEALRAYQMAKSSYEACPEEGRVHYGAVLNGLGSLYTKKGQYDLALRHFEKAADWVKRFFGENEEYGITFQNRGTLYEKMGDREKAAACCLMAGAIYEALWGKNHSKVKKMKTLASRLTGGKS